MDLNAGMIYVIHLLNFQHEFTDSERLQTNTLHLLLYSSDFTKWKYKSILTKHYDRILYFNIFSYVSINSNVLAKHEFSNSK